MSPDPSTSTRILNNPEPAIQLNLETVDQLMAQIMGRQPTEVTMAHMSRAQVYATCALVHAVRHLTETIRSQKARS